MTQERPTRRSSDRPEVYQIVLEGHLSGQWSDWFDGFTLVMDERGRTILVGPVADQPALHGVLKKIRDLGLPLVSVNRLGPGEGITTDGLVEE